MGVSQDVSRSGVRISFASIRGEEMKTERPKKILEFTSCIGTM